MKKNTKSFKALALLSGGLDSILAVKLIQEQGIDVEAVIFKSNFYNEKRGKEAAESLGIKYHIIDLTEKTIKLIENPRYGFGKNLNPCIDCHLLMIKETVKLMKKLGADFIITGEVAGQRPKSQNYDALKIIAKECGADGRLLRPLSAKKLEPTVVELNNIVDREKLLDITGKSRKKQMELAKKYNITNYPSPAGGCLLTVPDFSDRLRFNLKHKKLNYIDIEILKVGRHFATPFNNKIIIGRDKDENQVILDLIDETYLIFELSDNRPGPVAVLSALEPDFSEIQAAASLTVRYSKFRNETNVKVKFYKKNTENEDFITVSPKNYDELNLKML